jgi:hypothetical protein
MMHARIAKNTHLGERQFVEYPQIIADEWGATQQAARSALSPARLVGGFVLLAGLVAVLLMLLR